MKTTRITLGEQVFELGKDFTVTYRTYLKCYEDRYVYLDVIAPGNTNTIGFPLATFKQLFNHEAQRTLDDHMRAMAYERSKQREQG